VEPDPESLERRLAEYLEWMRVHHYSEKTVETRERLVGAFTAWCGERAISRPAEVTREILERYRRTLYEHRMEDGRPYSLKYQATRLVSIRGFFKWLCRQNLVLWNAASELEPPSVPPYLPRDVLSVAEAERVLSKPDVSTLLGVRDRAILETFYSTAIRRAELASLKLHDLDRDRGTLRVRLGKGRRQRVVPIGRRAVEWVERYVREVRPKLSRGRDEGHLFLTGHGRGLVVEYVTVLVRKYVVRAGLGKKGSVHLWRHSCATHMLEGGADVCYLQEMLGHQELNTTAIYTRVSIQKLKEVHERTHPAERRRARKPKGAP
jgi:integrase/recombinase XerD